jgi:magnesium transporter
VTTTYAEESQPLASRLKSQPPREAAAMLAAVDPARAVEALGGLNPGLVQDILAQMAPGALTAVSKAASPELARQWLRNARYPDGVIGRLMEPALAVFPPETTVGEVVERLRAIVRAALVTYGYVVDGEGRLVGLVTMRDLLFSEKDAKLGDIMLTNAFTFRADTPVADAMRLTLNRHYPVYPVCDESGHLLGLVRGAAIFEDQAFEFTAQPGSMVGVEKEERVTTSVGRAFRFRHPWLQLNLLTAFAAGGVVAYFQGTVDRLVILATFLPVLAGQSGNTGCQALAVTVRGITLGDIRSGSGKLLVAKEFFLGLANGAVTGVLCGLAMFLLARSQDSPEATMLGVAVCLAMMASCAVSGISGALVPLALKRLGADPATASSIIVTTATDVASMGMLLGLATLLIPAV